MPTAMSLSHTLPAAAPLAPAAPELLDSLHQHRALQAELQRQGFVQAGHHAGHPEALYTQLEALYEAYRHTNSREWATTEQQRREVAGRIRELETQATGLEHAAPVTDAPLEVRLAAATGQAGSLRQRLERVREEVLDLPPRNWPLLGLLSVVLAGLTAALYLFYACTAFRAFYPPVLAENGGGAAADLGRLLGTGSVFDAAALPNAFAAVYPALFPAVLLMLALCLHLLAEGTGVALSRRGRWLAGGALILLTLALDGLLAFRIHQQAALVQQLTGESTGRWYQDTVFYLVLACGLGASLLWGAGLHGLLHLLAEADPYRQRLRRRLAYEQELRQATAAVQALTQALADVRRHRAAELHHLRLEIVRLDASLHQELTVVRFGGRLKLCLDAFHGGWLQYALQAGHPPESCRAAFSRFVAAHFAPDAAG